MSDDVISFSPNDLLKLNRAIRESSEEMTKIEVMREGVKDIKKTMVDDLKESGLTGARYTSMLNLYHKNNKDEYFSEISDQEAMYENIFPKKNINERKQ